MIPQIVFVNFIAVLLVILFHYASGVAPFNNNYFLSVMLKGVNGIITYFFVLSGFLMTINYYDKQPLNLKRYFSSRFARTYPVYCLALLLWVGPHLLKGIDFQELIKIILTFFLVQSWVPNYSQTYNYPTWFLSVLVFFYIVFPFILSYITNKKGTQIFLLVFAVWAFSVILIFTFYNRPVFMRGHDDFYKLTLFHPIIMYVNAFIIGIAGGVFLVRNKSVNCPDAIPIIMIVFSLLIISFIISLDTKFTGGRYYYPNGLLSPAFLMLIVGLSLDKTILSNWLSNKLFIALGTISYSMYIFHVPIKIIIQKLFKIDIIKSTPLFFSYLIIVIVSSSIIYLFFEKPMRKYIVSVFNKT